jgi:polar amino acid transport system substrate-binding protein
MNLRRCFTSLAFAIGLTAAASSSALSQEHKSIWSDVQQRGVLRVGVAEAPPLLVRDPKTGNWSGYFLEVMKGFGSVLGVKVEPVETTWGNMVAGVQAGKWDIATGLNRKPERAMAVNYSIPIWSYEIGLLYDKRNPKITPEMKSLSDFDKPEITIAVMQGAAGDLSVSPQIKNAKIIRLEDTNAGRLAVISKRADIYAEDSDIQRVTILQNPDWAAQVLPEPAIAKQGIAFGFAKTVPLDEVQVLDIYLEEQIATGAVQRLYDDAVKALGTN